MEELIERIKSETRQSVASIEKKFAEEENEIISKAKKEASEESKRVIESAKKRAVLERDRIVSAANLEARKRKADFIDSVLGVWLGRALENIEELRAEEKYAAALSRLVKSAVEEIPSKRVEVLVSPTDSGIVSGIKAKGKSVKVISTSDVKTGTIVRAADRSVEINATFRSILENKKMAIKKELAKQLVV